MPDTSTLRLRIFDGSRQPFAAQADFFVRIVDGNQQQHISSEYPRNDITFTGLPFFDNLFDNYTVLVSCDGYKQAGYQPVKLSSAYTTTLDIMLVPTTPASTLQTPAGPSQNPPTPSSPPTSPMHPARPATTTSSTRPQRPSPVFSTSAKP